MKSLLGALVLLGLAQTAQAATISLQRAGTTIGTVDCGAAACHGWTGSGWSTTIANLDFIFNDKGKVTSDEKFEVVWVNGITNGGFTTSNKGGSSGPVNSLSEYVLFKVGGGSKVESNALLRNVSGGAITYTYTQAPGGNGLSHTNSFGTVAVPLPASGVLLGATLLACGWSARRRRTTA